MNSTCELRLLKGLMKINHLSKALRMQIPFSFRSRHTCSEFSSYCKMLKRKGSLSQSSIDERLLNWHPHRTLNLSSKATSTLEYSSAGNVNSVVKRVLEACSECLEAEEIEDARIDAEYIVSYALGVERHSLESMMNEKISDDVADRIDRMIGCRLSRMPLQYIIGNWDFHSITLKLHPPVFIPRPETEELVNIALKYLDNLKSPLAVDLCCGSGAISLALLHNNTQLKCVAVDQSKYAVQLTVDNAKDLHLSDRISVIKGKITEAGFPLLPYEKFDLIVSNPPYVLKKDLMKLQPEIFLYEDLRGLDGGIDGLDVLKNIVSFGQHFMKKGGVMLLEIDPCHKYLLPKWFEHQQTLLEITRFHDDFSGVGRFVELRLK